MIQCLPLIHMHFYTTHMHSRPKCSICYTLITLCSLFLDNLGMKKVWLPFINLLHVLRTITSSVFRCRISKSLSPTAVQNVFFVLFLGTVDSLTLFCKYKKKWETQHKVVFGNSARLSQNVKKSINESDHFGPWPLQFWLYDNDNAKLISVTEHRIMVKLLCHYYCKNNTEFR